MGGGFRQSTWLRECATCGERRCRTNLEETETVCRACRGLPLIAAKGIETDEQPVRLPGDATGAAA